MVKGFYVVVYRSASSHKCKIVTSANCAEADLAFLMAYVYGQSPNNLLQIRHQCCSFPLYASLMSPDYWPTVYYHCSVSRDGN